MARCNWAAGMDVWWVYDGTWATGTVSVGATELKSTVDQG